MAQVIGEVGERKGGLVGGLKTEDLVRGVNSRGRGASDAVGVLKILKKDLGEEDDF